MTIKELSEDIAKRAIAVLRAHGFFDGVKRKDNLTDVAEILPVMTGDNRENGKEPSVSARPLGTVIANDGTLVTLGSQGGRNASLSSTQTDMNSHGVRGS